MTAWVVTLLVVSVVFGGASRENPLRLMLVELACLPALFFGLRGLVTDGRWTKVSGALLVIVGVIAIPALQLVPLSPAVWQGLPGRDVQMAGLQAAGLTPGWLPFSLSPYDTVSSLLALGPPVAMFVAAQTLDARQARLLAGLYVIMGFAGLVLGAGQLFSSASSPFYLYSSTNRGSLVGFFANRNHEASFLLCLLPFVAVFATRRGQGGGSAVWANASAAMAGLIIVGLGTVHSRAGLLLAVPALLGSLLLIWRSGVARRRPRVLLASVAVGAIAIAAVLTFALVPNLSRFTEDPGSEQRLRAWPVVEQAATDHLPFGAGIGAFDRVYRDVEPLRMVGPTFLNHAHNDYLELWLEAGWAGAAVLLAALAWLGTALVRAWLRPPGETEDLQRAASLVVLLLVGHSFVDYPLRTTTMSVLLAFSAAMLSWQPTPRSGHARGVRRRGVRQEEASASA